MIYVPSPIPEPAQFDAECRQPGMVWLQNHPEGRYDLWSPFRDFLAIGFSWRCAYKAMLNHEGTVDHFVSIDADRTQAYEWDNYRYVSGGLNSAKREDPNILDPFVIQDNWFRLILPSLQLVLTDQIPPNIRPIAENTVNKLKLVDGRNVITRRKFWYNRVANNLAPLAEVNQFAPLVGRAIQEWLNTYGPPLPVLP